MLILKGISFRDGAQSPMILIVCEIDIGVYSQFFISDRSTKIQSIRLLKILPIGKETRNICIGRGIKHGLAHIALRDRVTEPIETPINDGVKISSERNGMTSSQRKATPGSCLRRKR